MFKKFFKVLFKNKFILLFIMLCSFAFGSVIGECYNQVNEQYDIAFKSDKTIEELNDIITIDNLEKIKKSDTNNRFTNIDVNKLINNKDIYIKEDNNIYHLLTKSRYYDNFFFSSNKTVSTRAKMFIKELIVNNDTSASFIYKDIYVTLNKANIYITGLIASGVVTLSYLIYLMINYNNLYLELANNSNEEKESIFSVSYWKCALSTFSKTKNIVIIAMLFALMMIAKLFSIPTGFADLRISFTYVFFALIAMMYGPMTGLIIGLCSDTLGFFIFPNGASFFFPYTIQAAISGLIYGLCLYKKEVKLSNVFFTRLLINMIMNVIWGSLCFGWLYGYDFATTCAYMLTYSLPKNLLWLIPQTAVLYICLKAFTPIVKRFSN